MYQTYHANPRNPDLCSLGKCPIEYAMLQYRPSIPGNAVYLGIFSIILLVQVFQAFKYKVWIFFIGMAGGLILEIIGYAGRLQVNSNPFPLSNFLIYFIPLTIGPAFFAASIYLCLGRIIVATTTEISRLKPRTYAIVFISCDFLSLLLQAVGGSLTATATTETGRDNGVDIVIAGLTFQVFSMAVYLILWAEYAWRLRKVPEGSRNRSLTAMRSSWRFKGFRWTIAIATVLIFIRCIYRVAELQDGFDGRIAQNQVSFMILEGPMIILATLLMTIFHPGFAFQGEWRACGWNTNTKKPLVEDKNLASDSSDEAMR